MERDEKWLNYQQQIDGIFDFNIINDRCYLLFEIIKVK